MSETAIRQEMNKLRTQLGWWRADELLGGPPHEHEMESARLELRKLEEELRRAPKLES